MLHRICERIRTQVNKGRPLLARIRLLARHYHGRAFCADPERRLALKPSTLLQWWYTWRRNGEVPSAFRLRYSTVQPVVPVPVLLRFINFCAYTHFPGHKIAWQAFVKAKGGCGVGLRSDRAAVPWDYESVRRYFTGKDFQRLQAEIEAIKFHRMELGRLRIMLCADLQRRFPPPAPSQRRKGQDFTI